MASAKQQLAQIKPLAEHGDLFVNFEDSLRYTPVKRFYEDGSFDIDLVKDDYYLSNDVWDMDYFLNISQFQTLKKEKWAQMQTERMYFNFNAASLNLEAKFVFHQMIFSDAWSLSMAFTGRRSALNRLAEYVNYYKQNITSFSEMQDSAFMLGYTTWLADQGLKTYYPEKGRKALKKTTTVALPSVIYNHLQRIERENYFSSLSTNLWDEDVWDIRYFRKFGLDTPKSSTCKSIVFTEIAHVPFRDLLKKYLKEKLLTHSIEWSTAHGKSIYLKAFFNYLHERHPDWESLNEIDRSDILEYLEKLSLHANNTLKSERKDANPKHYPKSMLSQIRTFFTDLQIMDYPEAPHTPAVQLIRYDDTKGYTSTVSTSVKYVPDYVLNQFFANIDGFPEHHLPVILTMYYTGLRISDVLELKWDCLVKIDGQYWVETYVWKTKTLDHRCPITDEFAIILKSYIDKSKECSNNDNNPDQFIFVHYKGLRKGQPYTSLSVRAALNTFAEKHHIVDETGNLFHFKNHAFRHTFSMKMLNNGADIITVMELLAHATPKMTLTYAKLLDTTKREAFEKVMKSGVFTFSTKDNEEIIYDGNAPQELLNNLWQRHKLEAIDTPYGTCLQRKNGRCNFAKQPPCLTCNNGNPCKDLCIGVFEGDTEKYDILINSTERLVDIAQRHKRNDLANENENLLGLLKSIRTTIASGGIIYGRTERLLEDKE